MKLALLTNLISVLCTHAYFSEGSHLAKTPTSSSDLSSTHHNCSVIQLWITVVVANWFLLQATKTFFQNLIQNFAILI